MADIFDVVDRELAEDDQRTRVRRFAPWVAAGMVATLVLVWVLTTSGDRQARAEWEESAQFLKVTNLLQEAQSLRDDATAAFQTGDQDGAMALLSQAATIDAQARPDLAQIARNSTEFYRLAARQQLAEMMIAGGVSDVGVLTDLGNLLGEAAADVSDPLYADGAQLKAVYARVDQLDYARTESLLYALTSSETSPYRFLARELRAAKALDDGQYQRAAEIFASIAADNAAPNGLRQRAADGARLARSLTAPQTATIAAIPVEPDPQGALTSDTPDTSATAASGTESAGGDGEAQPSLEETP